jgi:hypothetical protein
MTLPGCGLTILTVGAAVAGSLAALPATEALLSEGGALVAVTAWAGGSAVVLGGVMVHRGLSNSQSQICVKLSP